MKLSVTSKICVETLGGKLSQADEVARKLAVVGLGQKLSSSPLLRVTYVELQ